VRGALVGIALALVGVFALAAWLNPYDELGRPRRLETHRQLGLPACIGVPCPSCGMTTSFAFLVRGNLVQSLRANAVGTLLALLGLAAIPWSIASVVRKRTLFIRSLEQTLIWLLAGFLVLVLLRWGIMLLFRWY
jgi:hypothetical protein